MKPRSARAAQAAAPISVEAAFDGKDALILTFFNEGDVAIDIETASAHDAQDVKRYHLAPKARLEETRAIAAAGHWYDLSVTTPSQPGFLRRLAGHAETGKPSVSDPMIGATDPSLRSG